MNYTHDNSSLNALRLRKLDQIISHLLHHAQGQPLQALFAKAQALFAQAEGGSEPAAKDGVGLLRRCADAVDRLALFSW